MSHGDLVLQYLKVLRGCLAAYATGVFLLWLEALWNKLMGIDSVLSLWSSLFFLALVGVFIAAFITCIVLIIWALLAKRRVMVSFWVSPLVGVATLLALTISSMGLLGIIFSLLFGGLIGVVFWLAAFGSNRKVIIQFSNA